MPPRVRQTLTGLGAAIVLLAVFAVGATLTPDALITSAPGSAPPVEQPASPLATPEQLPPGSAAIPPDAAGPNPFVAALLTALGIAAIVAAGLLLVYLGVRVARVLAARPPREEVDEPVVEPVVPAAAVEEIVQRARAQIAVDDDANLVVVRCWEALERLAADAGIPRVPTETAAEHVVGMLARLDLPAEPARRLSQLYAAALFSATRLPPAAVTEALTALESLEKSSRDVRSRS